jgi:putative FmdB family regulatory protein
MPTYEYRCEKGHTFEQIQKMSDKPVAKCPQCGAKASRVISGGQGVIFKGSGFYITDYGKDGKGPRKESAGTSAETGGSSGDSKPEAKPEKSATASKDTAPKDKPASSSGAGKPEAK